MAVEDESLHHATDNLILSNPRKYYRANVDTSHWQLRSLISSPEQDLVYFPSETEIYLLNTKTQKLELVASLGFIPRCLVASKEWLCCGGENGKYSAISLKHRALGSDLSSFLNADPDSRLPLDLDPTRRSSLQESEHSTGLRDNWESRRSTAEKIDVGTEIVNCITLWFPTEDLSERTHKFPVAVVSNNDRTVSILDLATSKPIQRFKLPDCVNRSAISPDGELLVAICDDPFLYIHTRRQKRIERERFESEASQVYEWAPAGRIQLESQRQADNSQMRGSFALSFSRSGQYLAVATQYGIISVFDTQSLTEGESLMVWFTTSRPGRQPGAVRAMEFCPGPYDLLAWTESTGRVGVADVRTMFNSRQIILINKSDANVEKVDVSDRSDHRSTIRTAQDPSSTPDYMSLDESRGSDSERRQLRTLTREMLDRHREASTVDEELAVLQALRVDRQRREALAASWADPRRSAVTVLNSTRLAATALSRELSNQERLRVDTFQSDERRREMPRLAHPESATAEREMAARRLASATSARWSRGLLLEADAAARRSARLLPAPETSAERSTANSALSLVEGISLTSSPRPSSGPVTESSGAPESDNSWANVEALYRARLEDSNQRFRARVNEQLDRFGLENSSAQRSARLRANLEGDEQNTATDFARRRQPLRPNSNDEGGLGVASRGQAGGMDGGRMNETMGVCWSPDGRILYAATVEGIHEYHVNIPCRKKFPSLVLR
ncbi:uncharacterized protein L3040_001737 [Drepanopeziza brunnea f. sp. 'multigermtubi']|uniref:uncharacterized protein n=1 Tax=Drepanopeziza brunnea f. sp. 'multigermtubi' TaxID=698441 RepID=UPI002393CC46|nr:hypothetical protein L3040_001737 [Drepanopeziza brunnea f. sp. 'multigermtubi']